MPFCSNTILKRVFCAIALTTFFLLTQNTHARIAIIVNKDNPINSATEQEIAALFLAKTNRLKTLSLKTIDLMGVSEGTVANKENNVDDIRNRFYKIISNKSPMQMKAYWSRLIFTGKGVPPVAVLTIEEVIDIVSDEPNYIGYIDENQVNDKIKVLITVH
ncbi:MAG: hypothetical protein KUG82_04645 [Pseudomonadales bacterium]|nr:hypothetical protein [Pseudomonadales bacterium]